MKFDFKFIFFFIVIIVFGLYEANEMLATIMYKMEIGSDRTSLFFRLLLLLLCGGYCVFYSRQRAKSFFSNVLSALLLYIWAVSMLNMEEDSNLMAALMRTATIIGPLFAFYYFYQIANVITDGMFYFGVFLACVIFALGFIQTYEIQILYSQNDDNRFSALYLYLFLLPIFLCAKNVVLKICGIVLVAGCMVFSLKRGGAISFSIAFFFYYLVYSYCSKTKIKIKNLLYIIAIIVLINFIATTFLQSYVDDLVLRLNSIKEDEGSNRFAVYEVTWKMISDSDLVSFLFGHGWDILKKQSPLGLSAHNDFLEILYDCGLFAFCIYLYLVFKLFKTMFVLIRNKSEYAGPFTFSVITFLVNSTIAHIIIYPNNLYAMAIVWGYILGKEKKRLFNLKTMKR